MKLGIHGIDAVESQEFVHLVLDQGFFGVTGIITGTRLEGPNLHARKYARAHKLDLEVVIAPDRNKINPKYKSKPDWVKEIGEKADYMVLFFNKFDRFDEEVIALKQYCIENHKPYVEIVVPMEKCRARVPVVRKKNTGKSKFKASSNSKKFKGKGNGKPARDLPSKNSQ